jgi:predicted amidophosphoribosyltransferase
MRGASIFEQLAWIFANYAERRQRFCQECRVRRKPNELVCSNCGAQLDPYAQRQK